MAVATLLELRTAVRERSDTVNSRRVTDAKLTRQINSSIRRLHNLLVAASEDDFTKSTTLNTTAGTSYVFLPTDFLKLRDVEWLPGGATDEPEPLARFLLAERHRYRRTGGGWGRGAAIAYRLLGRNADEPGGESVAPSGGFSTRKLELIPTPQDVHSVVVWYVPMAQTLALDDAEYDGQSGFEEWVIWDSAVAVLIAEESDASQAMVERQRVYDEQIAPLIAARDEARPDRVVDMEGEGYSDIEEWGAS